MDKVRLPLGGLKVTEKAGLTVRLALPVAWVPAAFVAVTVQLPVPVPDVLTVMLPVALLPL